MIICTVFIFALQGHAQLDNETTSKKIEAEKSEDNKGNEIIKTPVKITPNNKVNGLTVPETSSLNTIPEEFSMFDDKKFANPAELYEKRINKHQKEVQKISEEAFSHKNEIFKDQNFGKFKTRTVNLNITFRDHGEEDGDYVAILLNDEIIEPRVMLTNAYKGIKVELKEGVNKIEFLALNEGFVRPNTAELKVFGDSGEIIISKQWVLSSGYKSTVSFIKEKK